MSEIFGFLVRVPDLSDEVRGRAVAMNELESAAFLDLLETAVGVRGEVVRIVDPEHPEIECGCVGPPGWHCLGEDIQHWAKDEDDLDSACGHCGGNPSE